MALTDFFRINLPYGIAKNENGHWMAFNREYLPIGFSEEGVKRNFNINSVSEFPVHTFYKGMTDDFLLKLGWGGEDSITRKDDGEIITVFFYNDATNPRNQSKDIPELWNNYFERLKLLSSKERK
ncbi:hypothetical protein [Chitinophaga defluvii]|uniref:Uncharacterized protein n=1 Tax=Chitinophaga defluvii TaxID=3163343 RepID=A0ABV2T450_9BACT